MTNSWPIHDRCGNGDGDGDGGGKRDGGEGERGGGGEGGGDGDEGGCFVRTYDMMREDTLGAGGGADDGGDVDGWWVMRLVSIGTTRGDTRAGPRLGIFNY